MLNGKHNNGKQGVKDKVTQKKKFKELLQFSIQLTNPTDVEVFILKSRLPLLLQNLTLDT